MTTTYDLTEVLDRLEDIVEEFGPETKQHACLNSTADGFPVCIVGTLLDDLGVELIGDHDRRASVGTLALSGLLPLDRDTIGFLTDLQTRADGIGAAFEGNVRLSNGISWGKALEQTKQKWGLA